MSFKPSKYQEEIFKFIKEEKGNAVINAVAGSGKTTTLIESLKLVDPNLSILFLAFNKNIKQEIEKRIKSANLSVDINTCHGFGYSTITRNTDKEIVLDNYKYSKLLKDLIKYCQSEDIEAIKHYNFSEDDMQYTKGFDIEFQNKKELIEFQKNVTNLTNLLRLYVSKEPKDIEMIIDKYDIVLSDKEIELAIQLLTLGQKLNNIIDYTDMLYLPLFYDHKTVQYDLVYIDECQDLNTAQRLLMLKSIKPNGRFIAVGDKNQAIYGFAGSDDESFDKLTQLNDTTVLGLSETYRCGHNIVETVKHIVSQIISHKNNPQGVVNKTDSVNNIAYGDMVLCRNTYPLVKLCLKFITENKKANVMGADIGKTLIKLIESTNETKTVNAIAKLYADLQIILNRIMRTYKVNIINAMKKGEYTNALERIKVFEIIYKDLSEDKRELVENIIEKLGQIFKDERDGILLSTIHRAKGLEADKVFIIHSELMPSPYAKKEWEIKQENNLIYVARTRAINQLSYVTDFDAYETMDCEAIDISHIVIKESQHVGSIGQRMVLDGEVIEVKHIEAYNEDVFIVQDKDGNIFEHWGRIPQHFVKEKNVRIKIGTNVRGNIKITKHTTFNDVNKNAFKCYK
jgi:superfamily I DNA/RNA helicase